jgi:hypothetical protein
MALHPRAATAAYDCGGRDACFCGTVGVAGDLCPKLGMLTYADVCCIRMLTYADVCCFCGTVGVAGDLCPKLGMLTYADVCCIRMLTYADVCCFCGTVGGAGDVCLKLGSDDDLIIMHQIHSANLALNTLYTF